MEITTCLSEDPTSAALNTKAHALEHNEQQRDAIARAVAAFCDDLI